MSTTFQVAHFFLVPAQTKWNTFAMHTNKTMGNRETNKQTEKKRLQPCTIASDAWTARILTHVQSTLLITELSCSWICLLFIHLLVAFSVGLNMLMCDVHNEKYRATDLLGLKFCAPLRQRSFLSCSMGKFISIHALPATVHESTPSNLKCN